MELLKEYDSYTIKDKLGKLSLLFFLGLFLLFVYEPLNWTGMIITGIPAFACFIYILRNDYLNNKTKPKEILIGLAFTLLFAIITLIYVIHKYSISIF